MTREEIENELNELINDLGLEENARLNAVKPIAAPNDWNGRSCFNADILAGLQLLLVSLLFLLLLQVFLK